LAFVFEYYYPIYDSGEKALYIVAKSFSLVALLVVVLFMAFGNKTFDLTTHYLTFVATLVLQLVPFILRVILYLLESFILAFVSGFVLFIIYFAVVFLVDILKDKLNRSLPKLEGKKIEVADEEKYYDDSSRFKGVNKES